MLHVGEELLKCKCGNHLQQIQLCQLETRNLELISNFNVKSIELIYPQSVYLWILYADSNLTTLRNVPVKSSKKNIRTFGSPFAISNSLLFQEVA